MEEVEDYKNAEVIHMDALVRFCPFFTMETNVNNGYGCTHPEQEEQREDYDTKKDHGCCFDFSCPLGSSLIPQEEPLDRPYFGDGDEWKNYSDNEWLIITDEDTLKTIAKLKENPRVWWL